MIWHMIFDMKILYHEKEEEGGSAQDECQTDQTKLWAYDFIIMILYKQIIS